jgi:PAS domain S-box-containing protein
MSDDQNSSGTPGAPASDRTTAKAITESEIKYRTIVNNVTDGLFIHDFNGTILDCNDHACAMLGYSRAELIGSSLSRIDAPRDADLISRRMNELLVKGFLAFDADHLCKGGSLIHCSISAKLVSREGDGLVQSFVPDISVRIKMERSLKESEELFRSTIEQSNDGFMMTDANMCITQWNHAMEAIFGYTAGEMVGKHLTDFQFLTLPQEKRTPEMLERLKGAMGMIRSERAKEFMSKPQEMYVVSKSGEEKTVQMSVYPIFTSGGICFGSINRDITFRKKAEEALKASEEKFFKTFEHAPLLHSISDIETGTYLEINRKFLDVTGYTRQEVIGKTSVELGWITPQNRLRIIDQLHVNGRAANIELECTAKNKTRIDCLYFGEIIMVDGKQQLLSTAQDITDKKQTEIALLKSEKMLIKAQKLAHIGHFRYDPATGVVEGSDVLFFIFGLSRQEFGFDLFVNVVHPDDREFVTSTIKKSIDTGQPYEIEHWLLCKNGEKKFINSIGEPEKDASGKTTLIVGTVQDITERKLMETVLTESEKRYRLLFENMVEGFSVHEIITDASGTPVDFRFIDANIAYERHTGLKRSKIIGKTIKEIMPNVSNEHIVRYGRVAQTGIPLSFEYFSKAFNRQLRVNAFSPQQGRFATVFEDITERKNILDALQHEQEMARLYFDIAGVMLLVLDPGAQILLINKKGCSMLGYTEEELIGQNWVDHCIPPEQRVLVKRAFAGIMAGKTTDFTYVENMIVCKNGSRRLVAWNNEVVRDKQGGFAAAISSGEDITARRRAETALAESELRNRELLDAVPDLIFKIAGSGAILDFKYDTPDQLMLPPDEVKGTSIFDLPLPGGDRANIRRAVSTALTTGIKQTCTYSIPFHGSDHFFEARIIREMEDTAIVIVRDITESKRAEETMIKTEKLESLGHMAGGIAHDFNNLLGGVFGYLEMAKEQAEADNLKRTSLYLSKALTVFDRAKGLTRQFLTFAKGGTPIKKTGDLALLLRNTVPFALSGSNVACDLQLPKDLWPCDFDENQMGQVIDNLVINAKQALDKGGRLEVCAANIELKAEDNTHSLLPGKYVRIDFKDNGPGIPKELHRKIFDPFFTTKKTGTGLGLATTYSIISKHGGHIDLVSEPGKGADFFIFLPASGKAVEQKETGTKTAVKGHGRILLMDDEHYVRDFGSGMLKNLGYAVETAKNGEDAIALYEEAIKGKKPFKAAIFDLTIIGGMGGRDAASRILELDPQARLIVSSGYSEDPVMAAPRRYGFSACIGKPYRKEELARVLSTIAGRRISASRSPRIPPMG